jgi:fluoride exporter
MLLNFLIVGFGGFLGAMARYAVTLLVARAWPGELPLATFLVNVSGSFVLGLFATLVARQLELDPRYWLFVATGFVGAYTTFSTFEYETQLLVQTGAIWWGLTNVVASVVVGYLAVQLGAAMGR